MTATLASGARGAGRDRIMHGLGLVLIAMVLLPGQDAIAKYISDTVSPGQITWARFLLQTLFTLPPLLFFHGVAGLRPNRPWWNGLRGLLIATSSMLFFTAVTFMPLADALAVFFVEPFFLTLLSAVVDKEQIDRSRKLAVLAGFIGVLIVIRPSYAVLGWLSLVPAAAGFIFALYVLLNRRLAPHDPPLTMQFAAGFSAFLILTAGLTIGSLVGLPQLSPSTVGGREAAYLLLMGALGTAGHYCFVQASRYAPSSVIAPLQYVEIVCAALFGYLIFGDFPDFWKWVGIAIVMASGAWVFWGESRR